jgi:hypothetical protein
MQGRQQALHELVMDSRYRIDPELVAGAIIARAIARQLVPEASFRNDPGAHAPAGALADVRCSGGAGAGRPIIRPDGSDLGQWPGWDPDAWA